MIPFDQAFPALVWNCLANYPVAKQSALIERLLRSGCRHIMTGGEDSNEWHTTADEEYLRQYPSFEEQDANFTMTSPWAGDSEDEVVGYLIQEADFEGHQFSKFLIIQVGEDPLVKTRLAEAANKWASAPTSAPPAPDH